MDDVKYWMWLEMVFGSNGRIWEIMEFFSSAKEAYYGLLKGMEYRRLTAKEREAINECHIETAEKLIENCKRKNVGIICYGAKKYPKQLKYISNPPALLYYKGNIECLSAERIITCVGTRKPTDYSVYVAKNICYNMAQKGVVLASGFARGLDITAHMTAAYNNFPTICVLGCGVDVNYPRENFQYHDRILASGGLFISEFPLGTPAHSANFPKRNRILSAISHATVVFEAAMSSGSLITARLASEQGREVFCMPPADIFNPAYSGNVYLLRSGATAFFDADDIIDYLSLGIALYPDDDDEDDEFDDDEMYEDTVAYEEDEETEEVAENTEDEEDENCADEEEQEEPQIEEEQEPPTELSDTDENISDVHRNILAFLAKGRNHVNVIAQGLGMDSIDVFAMLIELELFGYVEAFPGNIFGIKRKGVVK